jgi:arginyl-tRNA synthetase
MRILSHFSSHIPISIRSYRLLSSYLNINTNNSLDIRKILQDRLSHAIRLSFDSKVIQSLRVTVTSISHSEYGHYQSTSAMPLAKQLKMKPNEISKKIFENFDYGYEIESIEMAGPGFINIR